MLPPSLVPSEEETVYLVLDSFGGHLGICYREACVGATEVETVINDLLKGQYEDPVRVIAFNLKEGWSKDVSADIAHELQRRADLNREDLPPTIKEFVTRNTGGRRQFTD